MAFPGEFPGAQPLEDTDLGVVPSPAGILAPIQEVQYRTERKRSTSRMRKHRRQEIANRVAEFYEQDLQEREFDLNMREQRYAKYRGWTEGTDDPFPGASDQAVMDLMTSSQATQDMLHNAVMSSRPDVVRAAASRGEDVERQDKINQLLDYQFFVEQSGETIVSEAADLFVNDGVITAMTMWVRDVQESVKIRTFEREDPPGTRPGAIFKMLIDEFFPDFKQVLHGEKDGWDWILYNPAKTREEGRVDVSFYTTDKSGEWEMYVTERVVVYEGPRTLIKDYEDVLHPGRVANLQPPSPSNPDGAPHVLIVDYPTVHEIRELYDSGEYDLISEDHMTMIEGTQGQSRDEDRLKDQKDTLAGKDTHSTPRDEAHRTLTRIMCFDTFDQDGDGKAEQRVQWVIKETGTLLRSRPLGEAFPSKTGHRRPFGESNYIPVKGRREGISHLEQMEGLHDMMKQLVDQTLDNGTITNMPWGFYKPLSTMNPEVFNPEPGDLIPLGDPKNDVNYPQMGRESQAFGLNMIALTQQMSERLSVVGDLQLGRVPAGKSSALRTIGGMQTVLSKGESRPERILRRFFMFLSDVFMQMHDLNRQFLPNDKRFRIYGVTDPDEDPYGQISRSTDLDVDVDFEFTANVMNSSKEALRGSLTEMAGFLMNPLMIQMGLIGPEELFKIGRDLGRYYGQDIVGRYIRTPSPEAMLPKISGQEALSQILEGRLPVGVPLEPAEDHLQILIDFISDPLRIKSITSEGLAILTSYIQQLQGRVQQEQQQAQLAAAAQQGMGGLGGGGPQGQPGGEEPQAPLENNELMDETLPGAGGGGNTGPPGSS